MKRSLPWIGLVLFTVSIILLLFHRDRVPLPDLDWIGKPSGVFDTVIIDAGHGGKDPGGVSKDLMEKDVCLDLALRLQHLLDRLEFKTVLTRYDDSYVPQQQRAIAANREKRAIFVSIHCNKAPSGNVPRGVETYFCEEKPTRPRPKLAGIFGRPPGPQHDRTGEILAMSVQQALVDATGSLNRGVKSRGFYVLRKTFQPAILVECGFISNPMEAERLTSLQYRQDIAEALARGIAHYRNRLRKIEASATLAKLDVE